MMTRRGIVLLFALCILLLTVGSVVGDGPIIKNQPRPANDVGTGVDSMPAPAPGRGPVIEWQPATTGRGPRPTPALNASSVAIAVDDTSVYIVRGDEVLKLDKQTLKVTARGTLPAQKK